jgi:hypothetical protein
MGNRHEHDLGTRHFAGLLFPQNRIQLRPPALGSDIATAS